MTAEEKNHNCVAHCTSCQAHFTGTSSFDAHRASGECQEPGSVYFGATSRRAGQPILQAIVGRCDKLPGCWVNGKLMKRVEPVDLWQMSVDQADDRQQVLF
jgi:hypothetical protein